MCPRMRRRMAGRGGALAQRWGGLELLLLGLQAGRWRVGPAALRRPLLAALSARWWG